MRGGALSTSNEAVSFESVERERARVGGGVRRHDAQHVARARHRRGVPREDGLAQAAPQHAPLALVQRAVEDVVEQHVPVGVVGLPGEGAQAALVELAAEADGGRRAFRRPRGGRALAERVDLEAEDLGLAAGADRLLERFARRVHEQRADDGRQVALQVGRVDRLHGRRPVGTSAQGDAHLEEARLLARRGRSRGGGRSSRSRSRRGSRCCRRVSRPSPRCLREPCPPRRSAPSSRATRRP